MHADLVYDVGMCTGNDTGYYLLKGYRVVAIEANPQSVETARGRFGPFLESGQWHILNMAIAPRAGTSDFWVSESDPAASV